MTDLGLSARDGSQLCEACKTRKGTIRWGDALAQTHGWTTWRCGICALEEQVAFARARAAALPDLEAQLAELKAQEVS